MVMPRYQATPVPTRALVEILVPTAVHHPREPGRLQRLLGLRGPTAGATIDDHRPRAIPFHQPFDLGEPGVDVLDRNIDRPRHVPVLVLLGTTNIEDDRTAGDQLARSHRLSRGLAGARRRRRRLLLLGVRATRAHETN